VQKYTFLLSALIFSMNEKKKEIKNSTRISIVSFFYF